MTTNHRSPARRYLTGEDAPDPRPAGTLAEQLARDPHMAFMTDEESGLPDGRKRLYLASIPTREQTTAVYAELEAAGVRAPRSWPLSYAENVSMMVEVSRDLRAAGYSSHRGGGFDENDAVRELLRYRDRCAKIAEMHHKRVVAGGMTDGCCNECGLAHPCPTYDWARLSSDRDPLLSCWDRADDEVSR